MDENQVMDDQTTDELNNEVELTNADDAHQEIDHHGEGEQAQAEEPKEKVYTQKQLDRHLEKRVRKERRKIDELQRQFEDLKNQFMQPQQSEPEHANNEIDNSNLSPQEYARQVLEEERRQREAMQHQEAAQRTQQELVTDLMRKGREKYEDFEDTVNDAEYTRAIVDAALAHDNAEDVLMYFADNVDETLKLAQKSPLEQKRAVNRIAYRYQQKGKARASEAPEPMEAKKPDTRSMGNNWLDALQNPNISLKELAKLRKG